MPRPRSKSDDEILDATARVLLARGPHQLTLAEIGAEVGLSAAALVQRFRSKQGLLRAFGRRAGKAPPGPLVTAGAAPGLTSLRRGLADTARTLGRRRQMLNSLALLLEDIRDPQLRGFARRHAQATEEAIATHLRAAAARGELEEVDASDLSHLLYAVWNGALVQWALRGTGPIEDWVLRTVDLVLAPHLTAIAAGSDHASGSPRGASSRRRRRS